MTAILAPQGTSDQLSTSVRVVEPLLTMSATSAPAVSEAGMQMVSSISIPHIPTSNGAAYNVSLTLNYATQIHVNAPLAITSSVAEYTSTIVDYHTLSLFFPRFDYTAAPIILSITSTVNETIRPAKTYSTSYNLTWQSATNVAQSRSRSASTSTSIDTFNSPQMSSQPSFTFFNRELIHIDDDFGINVGETVQFKAYVALMHATFDQITVNINMPTSTDGQNTPLMAIESASVSHIGASITGADLAVGTSSVSNAVADGYIWGSTWVFNSVVNKPTPSDLGDDFIVITGTARVLNVPFNNNETLLVANATVSYTGYSVFMQTQTLMVVEGRIQMAAYNNFYALQAGDNFKLTTFFDHIMASTTSVYNITLTITHPPQLSFVQPLDVTATAPFTVVNTSAQQTSLMVSNMTNGALSIQLLLDSIINTIAHPATEYESTVYMEYSSSPSSVKEARVRNSTFVASIWTYDSPQFLSQPDFSFGLPQYEQ